MAKRKFTTPAESRTTLDEAFELFIEEKTASNKSRDTIRNYQKSYDLFYDYHELNSSFLLEEVSMSMFYKWINHMKANEIRPQSINHYLRDLRTFFNWANEEYHLEPAIKIKEIEAQEDLPKMYSDEEMTILLEKPRVGDSYAVWRDWVAINIVYATGLRASTLCALTLEDINFEREELIIQKQKNKKAGILPITPALATVLKEFLRKWYKDAEPEEFLLQSAMGGEFNPGALNHSLKRYCENRGIVSHGIHSVRHNFSRDMILNGAGEYRLQKYLQHSSIQMSQHYVKLFAADLKKDAEEFSPLDNAKKKKSRTSKFKKG